MVAVLLILDGASEPVRDGPTSLERARTPHLDALCRGGRLARLRTVAPGLPPGSEAAIPALLGWTPPAPVDRGALEAAAAGIEPRPGERAWRVDAPRGTDAAQAAARLRSALPRHRVHPLRGHRLLVVGPPPLPAAVRGAWPEGAVPPRLLDGDTVVIAASGAVVGAARLMGAAVVVPPGATAGPDTDLGAKTAAALAAVARGARRVVVHVGAPDEAAHARDAAAKVAALERIDRDLVAALARAAGTLRVCPDHGCDPRTGEHDGAPVPVLDWPAASASASARGRGRLTERAVAALPIVELDAARRAA